ncbi:MAG: tetratricopeptide repeat protein [Deltaproteobacteria bacterium]|nr:tetratricopeptide repeat protein [Deltaproteobacteria bacterium]
MRRVRRVLGLLALLLALSPLAACGPAVRRVSVENMVERLKRDVGKVRFAIRTTKTLLARARGARYSPELYNRLAELYVEEARYHYQIAYEQQRSKSLGVVSLQARLLKNQAIATWRRLLALFPEYVDADKVYFFMGHEMRELAEYEEMLKTYQELADKFQKSEYRLEALLVMGDYHFDKADLDSAEKYYQQVLDSPETRVHAMARYKMAWCKVNRADFKAALKLFEGSIAAARRWVAVAGGKSQAGTTKIDLRREALVDSVYCYTEVHKPDKSLEYFRDRADSKTTYLAALDKLGNRYYVKQNWKATAQVYREILSMTGDVEDALEYAHRLFESVTQGKIYDHGAQDVEALVRVVRRRFYNHALSAKERTQLIDTFEKYTRDIATRLQDLANQKKEDETYLAAAHAYQAYLSFFDKHKNATAVRQNLAESFYAAKRHLAAGQFYEKAAEHMNGKEHKDAVYTAAVAYFEALTGKHELSRLQVVQGRAGLRRVGRIYVKRYANEPNIGQVKFNIARTYYDAGEFDEATRLFTALIDQFPTSKEAPVAAHLVLDGYRTQEDYEGLIEAGKGFQQTASLGDSQFKSEVAAIIKGAEDSLLRTETLAAGDEGGEGTEQLERIAKKYGGALGEKALLNAFVTARGAKDPEKVFEVGDKFIRAYPASDKLSDVLATMGKIAMDSLQFSRGVAYLEAAARRRSGPAGLELYKAAATIRAGLGDRSKAEGSLNVLLRAGIPSEEKAQMAVKVARLHTLAGDWSAAAGVLQRAAAAGASSAELHYLLGYSLFRQGSDAQAQDALTRAINLGKDSSGDAQEAAAASQFYHAEIAYKVFEKVQLSSDLSQLGPSLQSKIGHLTQTRNLYRAVVQMGSGVWSVAALGRLANVEAMAAASLRNLQLPAGLPAEAANQVRTALASQAAPLESEAKEAIRQCAATAKKLKVMSLAAKACLSGKAPAGDPQAGLELPTVNLVEPQGAAPLQRALAANPKDFDATVKLGKLYLAAGNLHMARLILGKALELRETAELENYVGVATARLGEHQAAFELFAKALKEDSGFARARLNRASLLAKFGYRSEAQAEAAKARGRQGLGENDPGLLPGAAQQGGGGTP